jgi:hypothetical protein
MFGNVLNWFSSSKQEPTNGATWDATTTSVQNQQPTSPEAPSTERVAAEQPVSSFVIKISYLSYLSRPGFANPTSCCDYRTPRRT